MMFTKSKIFLFALIIGLNLYSSYAQEMQAFLKLEEQPPPEPPIVVDTWDRNDPSLIFWNDQIITWGLPIKHFNTNILPFELLGQENEINSQVNEIISEWQSTYCIGMYLDDAGNSVDLEFSTDATYFGPGGYSGYTALAVTELDNEYKFQLYA